MKLLSKFLPFIRGLYAVISTILYCGVTTIFSLIYYLLAILAMQKDMVAGGALFIDMLLNIQSSAFISSVKLAVIFFIPVLLADIFWETRSTHISGLRRLHLLVVRSVTAGVFYGSMYYFALHRPGILYEGIMIHFLHFLFATYMFNLLFRSILKEFSGSDEPLTLKSYLNTLNKYEYVEIIATGVSYGVYAVEEIIKKNPGYLNCVIEPNSITVESDIASNCIAMDSEDRKDDFKIIKDLDISYLSIEVKPPITKATPSKGIAIKGKEDDKSSVMNGISYTESNLNYINRMNTEDIPSFTMSNEYISEISYKEVFTVPNASDDISFRNELIEKTVVFKKWLNQLIRPDSEFYFYEFQTAVAEDIYEICMIAAYITNRSTDIKEFADCLYDFNTLKELISTIENHYGLSVSSYPLCNDKEEIDSRKNIFYPFIKSVKVELLGNSTESAFDLTRDLRTIIYNFTSNI